MQYASRHNRLQENLQLQEVWFVPWCHSDQLTFVNTWQSRMRETSPYPVSGRRLADEQRERRMYAAQTWLRRLLQQVVLHQVSERRLPQRWLRIPICQISTVCHSQYTRTLSLIASLSISKSLEFLPKPFLAIWMHPWLSSRIGNGLFTSTSPSSLWKLQIK